MKTKTLQNKRREPRGAAILRKDKTAAIKRASLMELANLGYARMTMEGVAKRAGVGKTALYRRWSNKEDMMSELLEEIGIEVVSIKDQGSLEADLKEYFTKAIKTISRPLSRKILPELYAEMSRNTDFAKKIQKALKIPKRAKADEIIARAIKRKEISPNIDRDLALDLLAAPLYWRFIITHDPVADDYISNLTQATIAALKVK